MQFWLRGPHFWPCCALLGSWASVGTILGSCWALLGVFCGLCRPLLGKSWDHIRLILGHFGLCWDILGHVGTILGSCWAILGYFRICVGLCFGLGHFNVVEFSSMPGVCKKHQKYQEKIQFVDCVADGFCCYFSFVFVSFLGHAAIRLCLPDLGLLLGHCLMLGHFGVFCVCGLRLPLLSHFRGILWFGSAFVGQELGPY